MKQTITITHDDGGAKAGTKNIAAQGQKGDTELAHVNPWEEMLLKKLGGAGTRNPRTGLKQFYTIMPADTILNAPTTTQNFGANPELNKWLTSITGYGGDYGQGGAQADAKQRGIDLNVLASLYPQNGTTTTGGTAADAFSGFNFPMDIMPTTSQSSSSSSYAGLPGRYQEQLLSALIPQLNSAITNMPGNIDEYTNQALGSYNATMDNALRTNIPLALRKLANRNILNSTEGQKVLSGVMSTAAMDAANKGYETGKLAAQLKANMPSILAQIGDLGKSSTSTTSSTAQSSDPTQMYKTMASLIQSMMG
jgi:hypothetical protein